MSKPRYPSLPACCQAVVEQLAREGRTGARTCAKGHLISLEHARQLEAQAARKAAVDLSKPSA